MAENKKSFVLYSDLIHTLEKMPDDKAGVLFKTILRYVNDQNPLVDDMLVDLVFEPIKLQMKRDLIKYEERKKKFSEAGKASAAAKKLAKIEEEKNSTSLNDVQQGSTKSTVTDTVNVNDNVNVTVINKREEVKRFSPPTLFEVESYVVEKNYKTVNAASFWNFYETKNWMVGKNKMKNWKTAVGGWEARNKDQNNGKSVSNPIGKPAAKISGRANLSASDDYFEFT